MSAHTDSVEFVVKELERVISQDVIDSNAPEKITNLVLLDVMHAESLEDTALEIHPDKLSKWLRTTLQAHTSQQVEEAVRKLSPWLQHDATCFLYLEEGTPDQCDCGLSKALAPNHQD